MFAFSVILSNTKHVESTPQTKFETCIINMRDTKQPSWVLPLLAHYLAH